MLEAMKSGGSKSKTQSEAMTPSEEETNTVAQERAPSSKGVEITLKNFEQMLFDQTAEATRIACLLFKQNSDTVEALNSKITELQKENSDLKMKLGTALAKQETLEQGRQLLFESFEKFRNVCLATDQTNKDAMATPRKRGRPFKGTTNEGGVAQCETPPSTRKKVT